MTLSCWTKLRSEFSIRRPNPVSIIAVEIKRQDLGLGPLMAPARAAILTAGGLYCLLACTRSRARSSRSKLTNRSGYAAIKLVPALLLPHAPLRQYPVDDQ